MHGLKSEVRLTRVRKYNSVQQNLFVFSRPFCAGFTDVPEELSCCFFVPSTEMKEGSVNSRMVGDNEDCKKL